MAIAANFSRLLSPADTVSPRVVFVGHSPVRVTILVPTYFYFHPSPLFQAFCCTGQSQGCDGGFTGARRARARGGRRLFSFSHRATARPHTPPPASRADEAWQWFTSKGVVTGGLYESVGDGKSCYPYPFLTCAHHEPNPAHPNCPANEVRARARLWRTGSLAQRLVSVKPHHLPPRPAPSQFPTPSCPRSKGCPNTGYPTAWTADGQTAATSYNLQTPTAAMTDMVARGTVTASFQVYADFLTYKSGVYSCPSSGQPLGGHAISIIGFGTDATGGDYWLARNR